MSVLWALAVCAAQPPQAGLPISVCMALGGLPTPEFYHENHTDVTTGPHPPAEPGPALSRVKPRLRQCPGTVLRTKAQAERDGGA